MAVVHNGIFKRKKYSYDWCPTPVYFKSLLLVIYLSAFETIINFVVEKLSLIGFTSFGFAQNTILDFQNTILNSYMCISSTNATKMDVSETLHFFFFKGRKYCVKRKKMLDTCRYCVVRVKHFTKENCLPFTSHNHEFELRIEKYFDNIVWKEKNLVSSIFFFPPTTLSKSSFLWKPSLGDSVVSVSDSWPGGYEFETHLRWTFCQAYFHLSPLVKHVRKIVSGF